MNPTVRTVAQLISRYCGRRNGLECIQSWQAQEESLLYYNGDILRD